MVFLKTGSFQIPTSEARRAEGSEEFLGPKGEKVGTRKGVHISSAAITWGERAPARKAQKGEKDGVTALHGAEGVAIIATAFASGAQARKRTETEEVTREPNCRSFIRPENKDSSSAFLIESGTRNPDLTKSRGKMGCKRGGGCHEKI